MLRCITAMSVLGLAAVVQAAPVVYTIDPAQSSLTLTSTTLLAPTTPQKTGANIDNYAGTISADLTGSTLTFGGGSVIDANLSAAAPFTPANNGIQDNYGMVALGLNVPGLGIVDAFQAFRDLILDIPSGAVASGNSPSGLGLSLTSGIIDAAAGPIAGNVPLTGKTASNTTAVGNLVLSLNGNIQTLTIPFGVTFDTTTQGIPSNMTLTGTIVATRTVPEPASLSILGLGAALLLSRRRA